MRCQLLEWYSQEYVVVGEVEFCSTDPVYKIGCIPLGPNAAAIIVKSVSKEGVSLGRPTETVTSLGQAVGIKIAWPSDKIILDSEVDSPAENNAAGSSVIAFNLICLFH